VTSACGTRFLGHLAGTYRLAGWAAQRAFWGTEPQEASMLAQIAARTRPIG
jgi:hypothetical protein